MQIILNRIEILKAAIALQDMEDIAFQSAKLEKLLGADVSVGLADEIRAILHCIGTTKYNVALQAIT